MVYTKNKPRNHDFQSLLLIYQFAYLMYKFNFVLAINNQSQSTGAILADVLDEDKRLEMLSCIVANPSPQIVLNFKFSIYFISVNQLLLFFRSIGKKSYLMAAVKN